MKRVLTTLLVVAGLALAADSARAQAIAVPPSAVRYVQAPAASPATYYYSNGFYYRSAPAYNAAPSSARIYYSSPTGYYEHNGVLRGPSGAMTGRATHNFDPTGRGVQLYKPWLKPLR